MFIANVDSAMAFRWKEMIGIMDTDYVPSTRLWFVYQRGTDRTDRVCVCVCVSFRRFVNKLTEETLSPCVRSDFDHDLDTTNSEHQQNLSLCLVLVVQL